MKAVEAEGSTVEDAVERALILLDLPREKVDTEVLREPGSAGLTALVRVSPKGRSLATRPSETQPDPTSEVSRETSYSSSEGELAKETLEEILRKMDLDCQVSSPILEDDGQRMRLSISGGDAALVIGRQGQTLDAIEFFVNRMFERKCPGAPHVSLDAEGYRDRRADKLMDMAMHHASEVRRSGRPVALEPMSPRDRRSIHLALRDEHGIVTRSEGEGQYRYVVIEPAGPLKLGARRQTTS